MRSEEGLQWAVFWVGMALAAGACGPAGAQEQCYEYAISQFDGEWYASPEDVCSAYATDYALTGNCEPGTFSSCTGTVSGTPPFGLSCLVTRNFISGGQANFTVNIYAQLGECPPSLSELKDFGNSCSVIRNPINAATGNKFQLERDYTGAGDHPLRMERFYNSTGALHAQTSYFGPEWFTHIGQHWRHTYDRTIKRVESPTLTTAFVYRPDGKVHLFNFSNDQYYTDSDISSRLLRLEGGSGNPTGWEYQNADDDSIEVYDNDGRLVSITSRGGLAQTLGYDGAGRLNTVTDAFGRQLIFSYDASDRIMMVTVPGGGGYLYGYDANDNLTSATYPDTRVRTFIYNESAYTAGTNLPHALTGILDENNQRFATYQYNSVGRATSTEHAGGAERATFAYNGNGTTTVTDALNTARTYSFQSILGVTKITSLSQPCTDCGGNAAATVYDANGNATSKTDFNGNQTTYVYDLTRNLETSRTEAYGTPDHCDAVAFNI